MSLQGASSIGQAPLYLAQPRRNDDGTSRLRKLLIANRGEIACRIIDTCKKLGIATVAVFVQEDESSRHVALADEAVSIGRIDQEGGNPYLNAAKLVHICTKAGADAIHPGYGYLSENADFADQVRNAGIIFVGPSSAAMSTLGDKRTAKAYLREHDSQIPLIPGFTGSSQSSAELEKAAAGIGFPVMLKASAGGGGKGMRVVHHPQDLAEELKSAQSEASRSFGSSDCILEKYIEAGKHIEIQIIGDSHGNVISLHERECSVQRRHQKVIEESPSPWMTPEKRQAMSDAAVRIGKLLKYENAGTVEFVVDAVSGHFYFLEVNTRLQVEHPITEQVTGVDVVALQILVATGGSLSDVPALHPVPQRGHAIECRLCAEDPNRGFYPERGTIRLWRPAESPYLRVETAIQTGAEVSIYFDSMIAKMVVWAPTRQLAIDEMARVLANTACVGVRTNQLFLQSCLLHPGFQDPYYTTSFIPDNLEKLLLNPYMDDSLQTSQMLSVIPALWTRDGSQAAPGQPFQHVRTGFRNQLLDPVNIHTDIVTSRLSGPLVCTWPNSRRQTKTDQRVAVLFPVPAAVEDVDESASVSSKIAGVYNKLSNTLHQRGLGVACDNEQSFHVQLDDNAGRASYPTSSNSWTHADVVVDLNGRRLQAMITADSRRLTARSTAQTAEAVHMMCHFPVLGDWVDFKVHSILSYHEGLRQAVATSGAASKQLFAPMPCKIISVARKTGEDVMAGDLVVVVESMKMEINMSMPAGGKIEVYVGQGDAVEEGTLLCEVM